MQQGPVRTGLESALEARENSSMVMAGLSDVLAKDAATIAAARLVADKMDQQTPGDNVTANVYLKYLEALGLTR